MTGTKIGREKVIKLIDDLVAELEQDQIRSMITARQSIVLSNLTFLILKKGSDKSSSDLETATVEAKDGILTLKGEIGALRLSVFCNNGRTEA